MGVEMGHRLPVEMLQLCVTKRVLKHTADQETPTAQLMFLGFKERKMNSVTHQSNKLCSPG